MCSDLGGFFLKLVAEQGAVVRLSQFASHSLSSPLKVCNHNIKLETVGEAFQPPCMALPYVLLPSFFSFASTCASYLFNNTISQSLFKLLVDEKSLCNFCITQKISLENYNLYAFTHVK
ncbi:hypothetical protein Bca101_042586 [Brassica carinata]